MCIYYTSKILFINEKLYLKCDDAFSQKYFEILLIFIFKYFFEFIILYSFSRFNFTLFFERINSVKISSNMTEIRKSIFLSALTFRSVFRKRVIRRRFAKKKLLQPHCSEPTFLVTSHIVTRVTVWNEMEWVFLPFQEGIE